VTTVQNFIDGQLVDSVSGATMPLVDPSTGETYGTAPISNEQDIDNAYVAAAKAFKDWKRTTPSHRQKALLDFADEVEKAADELVAAE
jgi:betaine-aldehyde dehydrogenase